MNQLKWLQFGQKVENNSMNNGVDYTIISKPFYIAFECQFCHEEVKVNFDEADFNTDYWGGSAWCDCPECGRLMGVADEDIDKMMKVNSKTQLYKQFGNSIVVDVMCAMFLNLNIKRKKEKNNG